MGEEVRICVIYRIVRIRYPAVDSNMSEVVLGDSFVMSGEKELTMIACFW
jgi:hypothetical protein